MGNCARLSVVAVALLCGLVQADTSPFPARMLPGFVTGKMLREWVEANERIRVGKKIEPDDYSAASSLYGYVAGNLDILAGRMYCPPYDMNVEQAAAIVGKYVSSNPKMWHKPGRELVALALIDAFPTCPPPKP